jgi:hypothetical protein
MRHPIEFLFPQELGAELISSFVIIACSLMVYYATKELYELSSYKGIKYFRRSFLFFAIAYFFRYFVSFVMTFLDIWNVMKIPPHLIFEGSLLVFMYSSSMAVFYLLYSVMWKRWENSKIVIYLLNFLAIIIAMIGVFVGGMQVALLINFVLLVFVAIVLIVAYRDSKMKHGGKSLFVIYPLLFVFWVINVIDILIPKFFYLFKIGIYLASIFIFMVILYKVLRKVGD